MRLLKRIAWGLLVLAVLLAVGEIAARHYDPATTDEHEVLATFLPTLQPPYCAPVWTSGALEGPKDQRWTALEIDAATIARLEAGRRRAVARDIRLPTDKGLVLPVLGWLVELPGCWPPLHVSTPAFSGNLAYVTVSNSEGVSTSAFERRPDHWAFLGVVADGDGHMAF